MMLGFSGYLVFGVFCWYLFRFPCHSLSMPGLIIGLSYDKITVEFLLDLSFSKNLMGHFPENHPFVYHLLRADAVFRKPRTR